MKNTLKVIAALLVFIFGIITIDTLFVKEEKKEETKKDIEFQLSFSIDNLIGEYEIVEFADEEKEVISGYLSNLNYNKESVDLAFLGDYKIVFDDKELVFDDNNDPYGQIIVDGKSYIINIKELKKTILEYINNKNLLKVYLYERADITTFDFTRIELSDEDKFAIKESFNNIRTLEEHEIVNLAIAGKYTLIVGHEKVYFDDLSGYAMYYDEMVRIDSELIAILKRYIQVFSNEECCSCCPDAEPGEVCIDACCSCTEGGVINAE